MKMVNSMWKGRFIRWRCVFRYKQYYKVMWELKDETLNRGIWRLKLRSVESGALSSFIYFLICSRSYDTCSEHVVSLLMLFVSKLLMLKMAPILSASKIHGNSFCYAHHHPLSIDEIPIFRIVLMLWKFRKESGRAKDAYRLLVPRWKRKTSSPNGIEQNSPDNLAPKAIWNLVPKEL